MQPSFIVLLDYLYGLSGVISLIAYRPMIKDLLQGIPSANFRTYFLWCIYYVISALYAMFVIQDTLFIILSCMDALILLFISTLIIKVHHVDRYRQTKRTH